MTLDEEAIYLRCKADIIEYIGAKFPEPNEQTTKIMWALAMEWDWSKNGKE